MADSSFNDAAPLARPEQMQRHPEAQGNAQILAADVWNDMRLDRGQKGLPKLGEKANLPPEFAEGPAPAEPDRKKVSFDEPFDKARAAQLIGNLGSNRYLDRQGAQDKLEKMGAPALPQLEEARHSRDLEVRTRAERAIETINNGLENNTIIDARQTWSETKDGWKSLIGKAGKSLVDNAPMIIQADGQAAVQRGSFILSGPGKSAPTKEEQVQFDAMVKRLDSVPDLKGVLQHSKERAASPDATPQEKAEHEALEWLDTAKGTIRTDYARALSASKDPGDLKKGQDLLVDHLKRFNGQLSESEKYSMLTLALDLGAEKNPEFLQSFKEKGGSTDKLHDMQMDRADEIATARVKAEDARKRALEGGKHAPADGQIADPEAEKKLVNSTTAAWDEVKPVFQDLLRRVGSLPDVDGKDQLSSIDDIPTRDLHTTNFKNSRTAPTKDEQPRFDDLIKRLDSLPDFDQALAHKTETGRSRKADPEEKSDYEKMTWLNRAQTTTRQLYASALATSADPADRAKGGRVLTEDLQKTKELMVDDDGMRVGYLAIRLGVDKDPAFQEAFVARAGNLERLQEQRVRYEERQKKEAGQQA